MTARTILIVVLALVFGGAAAVYATNALHRQRDESPTEKVAVVYARETVLPGKVLKDGMLEIKQVNKGEEPDDAVTDITELTKGTGRVTNVKIVKGAIVQRSMLEGEGVHAGMASLIRKNKNNQDEWMQAATILTPTASVGVGGFIAPGNYVDVLLTIDKASGEEHGGMVRRLMQRVEVLAADYRTETNPSSPDGRIIDSHELRHVTLLVTPHQGQELALAQKQGTLTLVLRNPEDETVLPDTVVTPDDLKLTVKKPDAKPPEVRPVANTKVEPPVPIRAFVGGMEYPIYVPK